MSYEISITNSFDNNDDIKKSEEFLTELINQKLAFLILYYELQKWNFHICLNKKFYYNSNVLYRFQHKKERKIEKYYVEK